VGERCISSMGQPITIISAWLADVRELCVWLYVRVERKRRVCGGVAEARSSACASVSAKCSFLLALQHEAEREDVVAA
jgi:hypothetical protein